MITRSILIFALAILSAESLPAQRTAAYTRADTLRGSFTTPGRVWWDVTFYDLHVSVQPKDSTIRGRNAITYRVLEPGQEMQIDLMTPLEVDSMVQDGRRVPFRREGNAFFATLSAAQGKGALQTITVHYHGRPTIAKNPPWDGGLTLAKDSLGRPWIATSNQGVGASIWWPNKDTQADEPDSQRIAITVPKPLIDVSNGRLRKTTSHRNGTTTYEWFVKNPINNYNVAINAGAYAHFSDIYEGEGGRLTLDYYPLSYHLEAAKKQFAQVKPMLKCFEHWFGPYPWYEDGFKLIETPYLGMEHQSAVAYGNRYVNGYRGRDRSSTGIGLEFDFIIVHETAHEWWGNNISTKDIADMWVHESFANYAEGLHVECLFGKEQGATYTVGQRQNIRNEEPIIPTTYGVNAKGSGDMYDKGGNMLHTIRQIMGDDEKWRGILRGLNRTFRHQTVTGKQVEDYISAQAGINLGKVFDQYLRTTQIPIFEYRIDNDTLSYRWTNTVPDFDMPLRVTVRHNEMAFIKPTTAWQKLPFSLPDPRDFQADRNFYIGVMRDLPL